jgi:hypothetical protein
VSQAGREVTLQAGEAVLASVDSVVTTMKASGFLSFRLPRARLEPLVADLELVVAQQVYDLITSTLGAHRDARELAAVGACVPPGCGRSRRTSPTVWMIRRFRSPPSPSGKA